MRIALVLLIACSSPAKSTTSPATTSTSSTATTDATPSTTAPTTAPAKVKAQYSCFSYAAKNSTQKRHACARTDDCPPYLEQAKGIAGLKDFSGCENVATVFCFHQAGTTDAPDGQDVCQPSLDECKQGRADIVRAKLSVDSDCAQK
jgi:hypothetical protein